jgi:hypothetical protein
MNKHEHIANMHMYITQDKTVSRLTNASAIFFDHVPSAITNISPLLCLLQLYFNSFDYIKC